MVIVLLPKSIDTSVKDDLSCILSGSHEIPKSFGYELFNASYALKNVMIIDGIGLSKNFEFSKILHAGHSFDSNYSSTMPSGKCVESIRPENSLISGWSSNMLRER